jgi:hypothetical protein
MASAAFTAFGSTVELATAARPAQAHPNDPYEVWACEPGENVGRRLASFHPGSGRVEFDGPAITATVKSLVARHQGSEVTSGVLGLARVALWILRLPFTIFLPAAGAAGRAAPAATLVTARSGGAGGLLFLVIALAILIGVLVAFGAMLLLVAPLLIAAAVAKIWLTTSEESVEASLRTAAHQLAVAASQGTKTDAVTSRAGMPNGWVIAGAFGAAALVCWVPYFRPDWMPVPWAPHAGPAPSATSARAPAPGSPSPVAAPAALPWQMPSPKSIVGLNIRAARIEWPAGQQPRIADSPFATSVITEPSFRLGSFSTAGTVPQPTLVVLAGWLKPKEQGPYVLGLSLRNDSAFAGKCRMSDMRLQPRLVAEMPETALPPGKSTSFFSGALELAPQPYVFVVRVHCEGPTRPEDRKAMLDGIVATLLLKRPGESAPGPLDLQLTSRE